MARCRIVTPEYYRDEALADAVKGDGRWLYLGLHTVADREGRLADRPRRIRADLFPFDGAEVDVDAMLEKLAAAGKIVRYVVEGERYIWLPYFARYQHPHVREVASVLPAPPQAEPRHNLDSAKHDAPIDLGGSEASPGSPDPGSGVGDDPEEDPRAGARRTLAEVVTAGQMRSQLKRVAHCALDNDPHLTESDLAEIVKQAAAKLGIVDYGHDEVPRVISAVRGERARRLA